MFLFTAIRFNEFWLILVLRTILVLYTGYGKIYSVISLKYYVTVTFIHFTKYLSIMFAIIFNTFQVKAAKESV